uniref:tRNA U34 2-thiouridine synthase MnmA/TrmU, contains the PP-loop ATPase domain n=1 Tax=Candidatus Kentrum sp. MB TaxID=2138164 RepID=A0A450XNB7_9GAMM|nr:MAG: tRNA U34 2-thiouridine synthase MnmA/TrmU, contains the PP-loop ATPase domain [Candidatus Kentron sp. MB]VFK34381.1 MAG: tRNA U34 2-thiouridine synthase MnmA/TrmU, contains the PP-loop ATPase domain [Candidatus Kentron sp. MB]VFK76486.1 MAG: tRNA U34 2-thiouridine synthase MnmA/TrmU, contains the PP-loop ATPase domain [Candidatus Kentron sp. MB]
MNLMEPNRTASSSTPKAIALISGGLDSMLAARVILAQGCHVEGINFYTGFCVEGHTQAIRSRKLKNPKRNNALWVAEQVGIELHIMDVSEEYKDVLLNPRYGYGAHMNPCLDCKCFMVRKAHEWMQAHGFDFIVTGEVIGQRPKSQRRDTMPVVARVSGADERLLRPLCAKNLPPTLPEQLGWVDRERLYDFSGRSRKPQMALAAEFGFSEYAQPSGGCCFLTDARYSAKLADLWAARGERAYELDDIMLLKVGRHIRPRPHFKLIVARDEGESNFLKGYRRSFLHLETVSHTGPITLIDGRLDQDDLHLAARLTARFSQGRNSREVMVQATFPDGAVQSLTVTPMSPDSIPSLWYL